MAAEHDAVGAGEQAGVADVAVGVAAEEGTPEVDAQLGGETGEQVSRRSVRRHGRARDAFVEGRPGGEELGQRDEFGAVGRGLAD